MVAHAPYIYIYTVSSELRWCSRIGPVRMHSGCTLQLWLAVLFPTRGDPGAGNNRPQSPIPVGAIMGEGCISRMLPHPADSGYYLTNHTRWLVM